MSVSLTDLVTRLQEDVPAQNDTPTAAQYERAVTDAIADLSRRAPMLKVVTLSMVNGTAAYALPDDFMRIVRVASLANPSGVIVGTKLIPVNLDTWDEKYTVAGRTITFFPTPAYSIDRDVWYAAGYVLNASRDYADLTEETAAVAMLLAQSKAVMLVANKLKQSAWRYQIGDEMVDKTAQGKEMLAQANELRAQYLDEVKALNGAQGARMRHDESELG